MPQRSVLCYLALLLLAIPGTPVASQGTTYRTINGNWTVSGTEVLYHEVVFLNGSLYVYGNLTLINSTIILEGSRRSVTVSGKLVMRESSKITSAEDYQFRSTGFVRVECSSLERIEGNIRAPASFFNSRISGNIIIQASGVTFRSSRLKGMFFLRQSRNCSFVDCFFEEGGLAVRGSSLENFLHEIVNCSYEGSRILYVVGEHHRTIVAEGPVMLVNCSQIRVCGSFPNCCQPITVAFSHQVWVSDSHFVSPSYWTDYRSAGVYASNSELVVLNSSFQECDHSIEVYRSNLVVVNCSFFDCNMGILGMSSNVTIADSIFRNCWYGISHRWGGCLEVYNCEITGSHHAVKSRSEGSTLGDRVVIEGCYINCTSPLNRSNTLYMTNVRRTLVTRSTFAFYSNLSYTAAGTAYFNHKNDFVICACNFVSVEGTRGISVVDEPDGRNYIIGCNLTGWTMDAIAFHYVPADRVLEVHYCNIDGNGNDILSDAVVNASHCYPGEDGILKYRARWEGSVACEPLLSKPYKAPKVRISPSRSTFASGNLTVEAWAEGAYETLVLAYYPANRPYEEEHVDFGPVSSFRYTLPSANWSGPYVIKACAMNRTLPFAVNYSVLVIFDNSPPHAEILRPENGSYVRGKIPIVFKAWDVSPIRVRLMVNGSALATSNYSSASWDTTASPDGSYAVVLEVRDLFGRTSKSSVSVVVDNTPPRASISAPTFAKGTVGLELVAWDRNLDSLTLIINGTPREVPPKNQTFFWDTTSWPDGLCELELLAVDKAGNVGETTCRVVVDNAPPALELEAPELACGVVRVSASIDEPYLENATLFVDGRAVAVWIIPGGHEFAWDTTNYSDGKHVLVLRAIDRAGNERSYVLSVSVDNSPPAVEIRCPGSAEAGTLNVTVIVRDPHFEGAKVILDGDEIARLAEPGEHVLSLNISQAGKHELEVIAWDSLGHSSSSKAEIEIYAPEGQAVEGGVFYFPWGFALPVTIIVPFLYLRRRGKPPKGWVPPPPEEILGKPGMGKATTTSVSKGVVLSVRVKKK